jgi:hypothetical protein
MTRCGITDRCRYSGVLDARGIRWFAIEPQLCGQRCCAAVRGDLDRSIGSAAAQKLTNRQTGRPADVERCARLQLQQRDPGRTRGRPTPGHDPDETRVDRYVLSATRRARYQHGVRRVSQPAGLCLAGCGPFVMQETYDSTRYGRRERAATHHGSCSSRARRRFGKVLTAGNRGRSLERISPATGYLQTPTGLHFTLLPTHVNSMPETAVGAAVFRSRTSGHHDSLITR